MPSKHSESKNYLKSYFFILKDSNLIGKRKSLKK
jgi:hypothetical protein